ncbi:Sulfite oxidase and related enzymes [invertebrate metagenome]|uniref:Sulfite oxidase and related enzymes n=1 Tax=invertebrate metagenome TaxID=1711999 RepID=A0A484HA51_9ZZZZ
MNQADSGSRIHGRLLPAGVAGDESVRGNGGDSVVEPGNNEHPDQRIVRKPSEAVARLPSGQHLVQDFPVLDLGLQPLVSTGTWRLAISGKVDVPTVWGWTTFLSQPQVTLRSDIHCVTAWSRYDNEWQGVTARHLLSVVRPLSSARFVLFCSFDGYTSNVPLTAFADDDVLLAHSWQGRPLTREHGGPVRVIIPKLYFWKSAKWVREILFLDEDSPGYWEVRGYHNNGNPWLEERYARR